MPTVGFTKLPGAILDACKAVRRTTHKDVGRKSPIAAALYFTLLLFLLKLCCQNPRRFKLLHFYTDPLFKITLDNCRMLVETSR
jgi:hypothetical protein